MMVLLGSQVIFDRFFPAPEVPEQFEDKERANAEGGSKKEPNQVPAEESQPTSPSVQPPVGEGRAELPAGEEQNEVEPPESRTTPGAQERYPLRYIGLGSLDPKSDARALVTLSSYGGSVVRLELNSEQYRDIQDHRGYLGHLVGSPHPQGWQVEFVGRGAPADQAGLQAGDVIQRVTLGTSESAVGQLEDLENILKESKPGEQLKVTFVRNGQPADPLTVTLTARPLAIMQPEMGGDSLESFQPGLHDAFSLVLRLNQIDERKRLRGEPVIEGAALRDSHWKVTKQGPLEVVFELPLPQHDLVLTKRFQLAAVPESERANPDYKAYHLWLELAIENTRNEKRKIAYQLGGPTGMPTEGWWYSRKIGRSWGGGGLRDVAAHSLVDGANLISTAEIVEQLESKESGAVNLQLASGQSNPLAYVGTETQYFAAILIPFDEQEEGNQYFKSYEGIVVGDRPPEPSQVYKTNVTSQLSSVTKTIEPQGTLRQKFQIFTGPKKRSLLQQYETPGFPESVNLSELIYYGWAIWGFFARPLTDVLNFFYSIIPNYAVAIVLLTVLVRLCMFPLSRKQALNAQKMQELQPEIKKVSEKYKGDMEKRSKALQDLYRKKKVNPLAGCLPLFIQMPIFIGLYRALMTDVALRQAPLVSKSFPWADNLAAPDMFLRWDTLIPLPFLTSASGWLGPYLNILPLVTIVLFILQQKLFMPPPTDEQSAMQQKIMKYMMVFMGFLFFKVPSGLCLYFIVSSLWGIGERKLLPKSSPVATNETEKEESPQRKGSSVAPAKARSEKAKKKRRRKK
ncbi:MAG: YidC/Oxa1 family insertase periplasmic-domain containing protein [Pirellulales bacterium]|nr:YidC/Oxa1 family insertase periplasmic-domain containing protein [Pirellulales bacterium]